MSTEPPRACHEPQARTQSQPQAQSSAECSSCPGCPGRADSRAAGRADSRAVGTADSRADSRANSTAAGRANAGKRHGRQQSKRQQLPGMEQNITASAGSCRSLQFAIMRSLHQGTGRRGAEGVRLSHNSTPSTLLSSGLLRSSLARLAPVCVCVCVCVCVRVCV